ncbi:MAG: DUF2332 domain-containing protein [Rhodopila sp.]
MTQPDPGHIAVRYRRFAEQEAHGRSPLYEALATGVADSPDAIAFLASLPAAKQQPNLLFAAVRSIFGTPADWPDFRRMLLSDPDAVRSVMLTHATQTNEPGRCAVLLPVLAGLPQPLALIEVGTSAGLCLLPELYGYDYGRRVLRPSGPAPIFTCTASAETPLPDALPRVAWRAGLDLDPLGVTNPAHVAWLETLVWPEQTERLERLRASLAVAATHRPRVVKGDLLGDDLVRLCQEARREATLVVFHSAVLAYVADSEARQAFAERVRKLCHTWIANEVPGTFPGIAHHAPAAPAPGRFLLSVNGSPMAWTDPHGATVDWIADMG